MHTLPHIRQVLPAYPHKAVTLHSCRQARQYFEDGRDRVPPASDIEKWARSVWTYRQLRYGYDAPKKDLALPSSSRFHQERPDK